jgi:hypothetical protein
VGRGQMWHCASPASGPFSSCDFSLLLAGKLRSSEIPGTSFFETTHAKLESSWFCHLWNRMGSVLYIFEL